MKLISDEETTDYFNHIKKAALQGAIVGGIFSIGLRFYIKHRSPTYFSKAGGYHRALIYAGPAAFCAMTNMERMATSYERGKTLETLNEEEKKELVGEKSQNWSDWLAERKYYAIVSGWAASLYGSYWIVNRSPFMTKSQKIVQARVYAQGLTVIMLLATVAFSVQGTEKSAKEKGEDASKSWERDLDFVVAANKPVGSQ